MLLKSKEITKPFSELIEIIRLTENASAKIHGVYDEAEIYRILKEEFARSKQYNISILLLTDDGSGLRFAMTSFSPKRIRTGEKILRIKSHRNYTINLEKSTLFRQVLEKGETIEARFIDAMREQFPQALAYWISKVIGYEKRLGILTPLERHGKSMGVVVVDSISLSDYLIPSVKNLARHISAALELADERAERKIMEEALIRERDLLNTLMNNIPDAIYFKDLRSRFTHVNKAHAIRMGARDPEKAVSKTDFDFYPEKFARESLEDERKILETGQPLIGKIEKIEKDGQTRWVSATKVPIKDEYGQVTGLVGISRDITEHKRIEDDLARERDLLQTLMDNIPDSIFFKDTDGRLLMVNKAAVKCTPGISGPHELIGKTDFDTHPKELAELYYADEQAIIRSGQQVIAKEEPTFDGKWVLTTKVPVKDKDGQVTGIVGIAKDITERKRMVEALRASEEQARNLLEFQKKVIDTAVVWIDLLDREGNVTLWNRAAELISGYPREEVIGHMKIWEWLYSDPEYRDWIFGKAKEIIEKGERVENLESTIKCKDGTLKTISWYTNNIVGKEGKPIGSIAVGIDVTERKHLESKIEEYTKHLEQLVDERTKRLREAERLAAIGETAAIVGHDLRNPLQVISNLLYLMEKAVTKIPPRCREIVEKKGLRETFEDMTVQVEYMNKIVFDLQDYARPLETKLVETDLRHLMEETLSTLMVQENIKVSLLIPEDFPKLLVDSTLMRRVFTNLITNAHQAMPEGGELTIKASRVDKDVLINIKDTGIGIPKENLEKIFKPLFTTKAKGTGLGLPACKRLAEAQSGSITVESEVGKGSIFTVRIPLRTVNLDGEGKEENSHRR